MLRAGEVVSTAAGRRVLTVPGNAYSPNYTLFRERISVQPCSSPLFVYVIHKAVLFPQISTQFKNKMSKYAHALPEFGRQRQDRHHILDARLVYILNSKSVMVT